MNIKKLSIVILTPIQTAKLGAGDWVQAYNTARSLRSRGHEVLHFIFGENTTKFSYPKVAVVEDLSSIPLGVDVIHFIPAPSDISNFYKILAIKKNRPILAASTIFWDSLVHRQVCSRNSHNNSIVARYFVQKIFPFLSRSYKRFKHYDLLLPNSFSEIQNVKNYFKIPEESIFGIVPNGTNIVPDRTFSSTPPNRLQENNYIVYPGVFSPRKNQLGFIRAMKDTSYKVAFMGGPIPNNTGKEYFDRCKKEAPVDWNFLGQVENGSDEFYGVLRGARVACLASSCETPGIALIEAASLGARPAMTKEGSGLEYFGLDGEFFNPLKNSEIVDAIDRAWQRGRLTHDTTRRFQKINWELTAKMTEFHYYQAIEKRCSPS